MTAPTPGRPVAPPKAGPKAPPVVAPPVSLSDLVTTGEDRGDTPPAVAVVHGGRGLGKTSLGGLAPKAIVLAVEDPDLVPLPLTVPRLVVTTADEARELAEGAPEPGDEGARRQQMKRHRLVWVRTMQRLMMLRDQPHDYRVLVIDTVDALEPCCHAYCCIRDEQPRINATTKLYGYHEGYKIAAEEFRVFSQLCQDLKRKRGMTVFQVAHSASRAVKDATMPDHEKQAVRLHKHAADLLCDDADAVLFVRKESELWADGSGDAVRMKIRQKQRTICNTRVGDGWDAKNRLFLPDPLPVFSWAGWVMAVKEGQRVKTALLAKLDAMPIEERYRAEEKLDETGWAVDTAREIMGETMTATNEGDQES